MQTPPPSDAFQAQVLMLSSVLLKHGLLGTYSQELLRQAAAQHLPVVCEGVAHALVEGLLADGKLPAPKQTATPELLAIAEAAVLEALKDYRARGGILLAKDFVSESVMFALLIRNWMQRLPPPILVTKSLVAGLEDDERNARQSVAAQNVAKLLQGLERTDRGYLVHEDRLEPLCIMLVRAVLQGFDRPNEVLPNLAQGRNDG